MANSILITGGAASGKSRFAVTSFSAFDNVLYLRMGEKLNTDIQNRINFNSEEKDLEWSIVHKQTAKPADEVGEHKFVIFDSVSAYTRVIIREMCKSAEELNDDKKKQIEKRIIDGITETMDKVLENHGSIVIITLETGFSIVHPDPAAAAYRDILGRVNQRIANSCEEAYFSASGIQFKIK